MRSIELSEVKKKRNKKRIEKEKKNEILCKLTLEVIKFLNDNTKKIKESKLVQELVQELVQKLYDKSLNICIPGFNEHIETINENLCLYLQEAISFLQNDSNFISNKDIDKTYRENFIIKLKKEIKKNKFWEYNINEESFFNSSDMSTSNNSPSLNDSSF